MPPAPPVAWVLETGVFADGLAEMARAVDASGGTVRRWDDDSWPATEHAELSDAPVVFHGSLGSAVRVRAETQWSPGAFCDVEALRCSAWYERAAAWLLHREWVTCTVDQLVNDRARVLGPLGATPRVFVRPDSPLKPFSGRVLEADDITLASLDHGYDFDDTSIAVVVAPVRDVDREWRHVVADGRVVAGSEYDPAERSAVRADPSCASWTLAQHIARSMPPPEPVYVLDVCESDGDLYLLELGPFSGADLYACDRDAVVAAVGACARAVWREGANRRGAQHAREAPVTDGESGARRTIYVRLLSEGTDVWRPAEARPGGDGRFVLSTPPDYDPSVETWEFPPGTIVRCEPRELSAGAVFVAVSACTSSE